MHDTTLFQMAQAFNYLLDGAFELLHFHQTLHLAKLDLFVEVVAGQKLEDHAEMLTEFKPVKHCDDSSRVLSLNRVRLL